MVQKAEGAPNVASAMNIAAFNVGIAGGSLLGGFVVDSPLGLGSTPWVGALVTLVGVVLAALSALMDRRPGAPTPAAVDSPAELAHV